MLYKDFKGMKLSALGMGAMRLPVIDSDISKIDAEATDEMVAYAMEKGINYYDTAWGYHNGNSEIVIGECLKKYPRDSFYLADKFPGYDLKNMDKVEEIFEQQLIKCQVEYFDFYLVHNVCELNIEQYLDPKYGIVDYLLKQKKNGRIKHLGFSDHSGIECFKRFMEAYGEHMEFCQIQLNYIDYEFQKAKVKLDILKEAGIPVWVMEPLRGGRLASLPEAYEAKLKEFRPDEKVPAWAFRYLQSFPEVTVVLSGMSNFEQLKENIDTYETEKPVTKEEAEFIYGMCDEMVKKIALPCTSCRYCTSYCPKELDIPYLIELYNEHSFTGGGFLAPMALDAISEDKHPSACIGCGACSKVCPQQIDIPGAMADFAKMLVDSEDDE